MLGTNLPNGAGISGQEVRRRKKEREQKMERKGGKKMTSEAEKKNLGL